MNDRLIKESDVLKAIDKRIKELSKHPEFVRKNGHIDVIGVKKYILAIPSADRPQGEWIWHEDEDICNCSECEFEIDATGCIEPMECVGVFHYCPNCGALMREREGE